MMRAGVLLSGLLIWCTSHAQENHFRLTSCPASSGVVKAEFNARYGAIATQAEYVQLLRRTFPGDKGGRYVHFTQRDPSGKEEDFVYHIPSARSHASGLVSLSSKGVGFSTVESKSEMRAFLRDTIGLWDTLRVRVRLLDADLAPSGYFLLWTDPRNGVVYKSPVPARGDTLRISSDLFGDLRAPYIPVRLRHAATRKQDLATCTLRVISEGERAELLEQVCLRALQEQGMDTVQRHRLLLQYCQAEYGTVPLEQLPVPLCRPDTE